MQTLVSAIEMAELDRRTIEELGVPGRVLMETAGRAVAKEAHRRLSGPSDIAVLCGTGNNGGDGYVAATALAACGHRVRVFIFGERARVKGDAKAALNTLEKNGAVPVVQALDGKSIWQFSDYLARCDLAIDAMLGTGARHEVRPPISDAIEVLNESSVPVVAVDVPSGVNADTGAILGQAVLADVTVSFAFAKRGHVLFPGAEIRGELKIIDIGIPQRLADELGVVGRLVTLEDGPQLVAQRMGAVHKGTFGHLLVMAGSPATPGAALLTIGGALRSGAGLVSWGTDHDTLQRAAPPPEVMLRVREDKDLEHWLGDVLHGVSAAVVGPGIGAELDRSARMATLLRRAKVPLCLDADALNLLAKDPKLWNGITAPVVATPHPKEMARLLGGSVEEVQRDRFAAALRLAMGRKCVVVLKGAGTVVADPSGAVHVIESGSPALATGGTGDVLAGVIGGFLAQGRDPVEAATAGALLHGRAGELAARRYGEAGVKAGDVIEALGEVFVEWER